MSRCKERDGMYIKEIVSMTDIAKENDTAKENVWRGPGELELKSIRSEDRVERLTQIITPPRPEEENRKRASDIDTDIDIDTNA